VKRGCGEKLVLFNAQLSALFQQQDEQGCNEMVGNSRRMP
jgi:hypothetical protein